MNSNSRDDRVGKVFLVLGSAAEFRRCLICLDIFTRWGSLRHSQEICNPVTQLEHVRTFSDRPGAPAAAAVASHQ